jgi:hypothetical protein
MRGVRGGDHQTLGAGGFQQTLVVFKNRDVPFDAPLATSLTWLGHAHQSELGCFQDALDVRPANHASANHGQRELLHGALQGGKGVQSRKYIDFRK